MTPSALTPKSNSCTVCGERSPAVTCASRVKRCTAASRASAGACSRSGRISFTAAGRASRLQFLRTFAPASMVDAGIRKNLRLVAA